MYEFPLPLHSDLLGLGRRSCEDEERARKRDEGLRNVSKDPRISMQIDAEVAVHRQDCFWRGRWQKHTSYQ